MKKRYISLIWIIFINFTNHKVFSSNKNIEINKYNQINKNLISKNNPKLNVNHTQIHLKKFFGLIGQNIEESIEKDEKDTNFLEISSDTQLRSDDLFIAEGNVLAINNNLILFANKLEYNLKSKILTIDGEIYFQSDNQFLIASKIRYDLSEKKGFILNAYGSLNFDSIGDIKIKDGIKTKINENTIKDTSIKNLYLNKSSSIGFEDINFLKENKTIFKKISTQKLKIDLNEMQKWRFQTNKISINGDIWRSNNLFLTNDPFNEPQVIINNKEFESINDNGQIIIKSKWSSVRLDDAITIPVGPRRVKIGDENERGSWGFGYDQTQKDGFFITRNFIPIKLNSTTTINLKKEFYIQRSLLNKTKSFSEKGKSILDSKVEQDTIFSDYFGLQAEIYSKLYGFDFESNLSSNSLDLNKLDKSLRLKSELSKVLYKEDNEDAQKRIKLTFFESYRDKVWNGSLGERDILNAFGGFLEKEDKWIDNKVSKSSVIAAGYGYYDASKRTDSTKSINRKRLNIFLERNHRYPIWDPKRASSINKEYKYTPSIIPYGLNLYTYSKFDFYRYDDGNFQNLLTFKAGPELTLGEFKNNFLDYTKISIYPKTTISSGYSPFGFDQAVDNHGIELSLKQQLIGALAVEYKSEYNLDVNSDKFHDFINTKYELSWNRRAFNLSAYYNLENKTGGFSFKIHSFNFDGYGNKFK